MKISTQADLENAAIEYGILPFFRNNIQGFSIEEMTAPELLFGGNEYEGCWEWKGPVVRERTTAYGKFFRKKAGFVSRDLLPYFLKWRRAVTTVSPGSLDEMIYDIIGINDKMSSTELRMSILGGPRKRVATDLPDYGSPSLIRPAGNNIGKPSRHIVEGPLQRLQMGGRICISDFRYKTTRRGERYGWGVAEYSTPETIFGSSDLLCALEAGDCLDFIIDFVGRRWKTATYSELKKLLSL